MRLTDTDQPMRFSVTFIICLVFMVSISLIALTVMTRAQEQLSIHEMSIAPLAVAVDGDSGGNIAEYIIRTEGYRIAQTQVSFAGRCDSACTLYLNLVPEQICLERGAYFRFHAPVAGSERVEQMAMAVMLERYPDWVTDWIFMQGGLTHRLMTMDYAYARQFVRPCPELAMR
jgi:hypothetical protein